MARTSSSDGTSIAYRAGGDGEPLVLVHGSGTSGADWTFVAPLLRERFTVVTMDRRGRGDSDDAAEHALEREAEDVLAVLDAVGADLLVGHSYGALCCIRAAERSGRLRRLVLYEPPIAVRASWLAGIDELVARGDHDAALEAFLDGAGLPADQLAAIRASAAWPVLLDAVPALPREMHEVSHWEHPAGPIDVPTLFLRGADTTAGTYLDTFAELVAAFPDSRVELIPGQRHIAHVLDPGAFAQQIVEHCA